MVEETKVTHDNNGRFYRIKMDLAKEGSEIWDLTPYFKGRVGDNRFGLQVVWTYQGRLLDTTGMKPYIEGNVGNYSFDDKKDLQLAPDAATVRYTGNPSDCQSGGRVTYYFPEQMFPRDGIFKGYIGLLDDRDDSSQPHISGVTVWFRVLPGIAQMGHACDVYISDLDKALQNFKVKLDQHDKDYQTQLQQVIDDARNAYESETKNAHDSLDALKAQIQANRDEQANLTNRLAGTEQQIETHDVVTRHEFNNLSNQLTQQVSEMREAGLEFFNNADDLKAKYPQGANKLCVTLNDSHEWVYDYANNQWNDAGAFNYGTIDPKLTTAIYQKNPDNLIVNSDFNGLDTWTAKRDQTDPNVYIDTDDAVNGSNALVINGYIKDGSTNESWVQSNSFPVNAVKNSTISLGLEAYVQGINTQAGDTANLELALTDKDGKATYLNKSLVNNSDYQKVAWENISLPSGTVSCYVAITMYGLGQIKIRRPQANFGIKLLPYSKADMVNGLQNLLADTPIINWDLEPYNNNFSIANDITYKGQSTLKLTTNNNLTNYLASPMIKVDPEAKISVSVPLRGKGNPHLEISQFEDPNSTEIKTAKYDSLYVPTSPADAFKVYSFNNLKMSKTTHYIILRIMSYNQADLYIGNVSLYQSAYTLDTLDKVNNYLSSRNCFYDYPITSWGVTSATPEDIFIDQSTLDKNGNPTIKILTTSTDPNQSTLIKASDHQMIKVSEPKLSLKFSYRQKVDKEKGNLFFGLRQYSNEDEATDYSKELHFNLSNTDDLTEIKFTNIGLNNDTKYIMPFIFASGSVDANFGNFEQIENPPLEAENEKVTINALPQLIIQSAANIGEDWVNAPFTYIDGNRKLTGYLQYAIQGDSSRNYPKKNLKLKFFSDENYKNKLKWKPKADWDKNSKFNLKANYIDITQSRNLVNSKMFAKATAITPFDHDSQKALLKTQNLGQMEGFPVEFYFNDNYYGLMTLNTKKDDKTYGLDSNNLATEGIQFETPSSTLSDPTQKIDGKDYSTIVQDKANDTLQANFTKLLTFISNSSDQEFKEQLHNYLDVKSAMNCMLWGILSHMWDYASKSLILLTWNNGVDFYLTLYDMDSTWNLYFDGSKLTTEPVFDFNQPTELSFSWGNKLYSRIFTNFKSELKDQYEYLRKSVWSNAQIISAFKEYINEIPEEAYEREKEKWTDIPSKDITDFAQIQQSIITRGNAMDNYMQNLGSDTKPATDTTDPTAK